MYYLVETLQIAGAIALAVFLMDSVFKLVGKEEKDKSVKLGLEVLEKI